MQEFGSVFNDNVQSSLWQPRMPDQHTQSYLHELHATPNALHDGSRLTALRGPVSAHQFNQFPPTPTTTHKLRNKNPRILPKLLPASVSRTVPRPTVVSHQDDKWLAGLLKRLKVKSWHRNAAAHHGILQRLLGENEASWTLASITLPPTLNDTTLDYPSLETTATTMVHITASIVYVDLVFREEVCFKLTDETIATLLDYHEKVHCPAVTANMTNDSETEAYILAMKDCFRQAINKFFFYTGKGCLEGTEDDGSGELCWTRPAKVKSAILALFQHPPPMSKSSTSDETSRLDTIGSAWSAADEEGGRLASEGYWQPLVDMNFNLGL